ncbi:MAG: hypothetical protein AAF975_03190 [Spirochaetota bacterium]
MYAKNMSPIMRLLPVLMVSSAFFFLLTSLVPSLGATEDGNTKANTFYLADGEKLLLELPPVSTLSGEGPDTVITAGLSQRLNFRLKQSFRSKKFSGFEKSQENTPSDLLVYLSQKYDAENNSYQPATALFNFRSDGLLLKCTLEAYVVEMQKWQKIGTLRLKGDSGSDQFQIKAIVARVRLSKFQLLKG